MAVDVEFLCILEDIEIQIGGVDVENWQWESDDHIGHQNYF